jgi:hypothetical protein
MKTVVFMKLPKRAISEFNFILKINPILNTAASKKIKEGLAGNMPTFLILKN